MSRLSLLLGACSSSLRGLGDQPEVCSYSAADGYSSEGPSQDTGLVKNAGAVSTSWLGVWSSSRLFFARVEDTGGVLQCDLMLLVGDGGLKCLGGAGHGF